MAHDRKKDVAEYFYGAPAAAPLGRAEVVEEIRRRLGAPGVAVFESLERLGEQDRRRVAALVQTAARQAGRAQLVPVLRRPIERAEPDARPGATSKPRRRG
jgi:hypothetical protein